jgi:quercetin dioxygenase-like cupin family protein
MRCLLVALLTLSAGVAAAQGTPQTGAAHAIVVPPDQITWGPAPPVLPAGAKLAVLEGNPNEAGPFTMRLLMPDRYRLPPHYHPAVEHVTVVKGTLKVGMGEKFDPSALTPLPAGTFAALEPGTRHFVEAQGETILQLHGIGPWALVYVNPADDPRRRTP